MGILVARNPKSSTIFKGWKCKTHQWSQRSSDFWTSYKHPTTGGFKNLSMSGDKGARRLRFLRVMEEKNKKTKKKGPSASKAWNEVKEPTVSGIELPFALARNSEKGHGHCVTEESSSRGQKLTKDPWNRGPFEPPWSKHREIFQADSLFHQHHHGLERLLQSYRYVKSNHFWWILGVKRQKLWQIWKIQVCIYYT